MNLRSLFVFTLLASGGICAAQGAKDYAAILNAAKNAWPGTHTLAIVCNYSDCKDTIQGLADLLPEGSLVKVADVRHESNLPRACNTLRSYDPTFVLLMREDRLFHDGGFHATALIRTMNQARVPTLATTPKALLQGALAVAGPMTNHEVMVNQTLVMEGTVGPVEWMVLNGTRTSTLGQIPSFFPKGAVITLVGSF